MAVSGLEQRNAPLVLTSSVWSPWGPYMIQPYDEEDHVDGTFQSARKMSKRRSQKLTRSKSWGGFMTYAAEAYLVGSCQSREGSPACRPYSSSDEMEDNVAQRHSDPGIHKGGECSFDSHSLANGQCGKAGSRTPRCTPETTYETASVESFSQHGDFHASEFDVDDVLVEASLQPQYHTKQFHGNKFPTYHAPTVDVDVQGPPVMLAGAAAEVTSEKKRRPRRKKTAPIQQSLPTSSMTSHGTQPTLQPSAPDLQYDLNTVDLDAAIDTQCMENITTLVIRNLPRSLTQQELVQAMEESGYAGTWDFCYLPYKFQVRRNFGFAFVNFASADLAQKFMQGWHQTRPFTFGRVRKPVNVAAAAVQGREANEQKAHSLMGQVKNPAYQPVLL